MNKAARFIGILFLLCSPGIQAGTIVEIQSQDELTSLMTNGQLARINM